MSQSTPITLISNQLYGRNDISGKSQNDIASVAQQQDAPEIMVPIAHQINQMPIFQSINVRFQYFQLLYHTAIRNIGKSIIIIIERTTSE